MAQELISGAGLNMDFFAGKGGFGDWKIGWGPASVFKYLVPHIQPGDRVLDLCAGYGRASLPLAFYGAKLTLVDNNPEVLNVGLRRINESGLTGQIEEVWDCDVAKMNPELIGKFEVVMAYNAVFHMAKTAALAFIDGLSGFARTNGGMVLVDGPSKLSMDYETLRETQTPVEVDTFEEICSCTGEEKLEMIPFFAPDEIESRLKKAGGNVIFANDVQSPFPGNFNREVIAQF